MAIQGFGSRPVERFFRSGQLAKRTPWAQVAAVVARKLDVLHYAAFLNDLRSPSGNRLEKLRGGLRGFYSIRVNDQWRVVFRWTEGGPTDVDVIDYH